MPPSASTLFSGHGRTRSGGGSGSGTDANAKGKSRSRPRSISNDFEDSSDADTRGGKTVDVDPPPIHLCETFASPPVAAADADEFAVAPAYEGEPLQSRRMRMVAMKSTFGAYEVSVSADLSALNERVFDEVSKYCVNHFEQMESSRAFKNGEIRREIPAASILAGVNVQDHGSVFSQLAARVGRKCERSRVVVLNARSSPNTSVAIRTLVRRYVESEIVSERSGRDHGSESESDGEVQPARMRQLHPQRRSRDPSYVEADDEALDSFDGESESEEDEMERGERDGWGASGVAIGANPGSSAAIRARPEGKGKGKGKGKGIGKGKGEPKSSNVFANLLARDCSLSALLSWATTAERDGRGASGVRSVRLVLVLPDIETFNERVLCDLMAQLSHFAQRGLNIVLLLGLATSHDTLFRLLPRSVLCMLQTERFSLQPPMAVLEALIGSVALHLPLPVISTRVVDVLVDHFLFNSFSAVAFVRGVRLVLIDYFSTFPLSYLTQYHSMSSADSGKGKSKSSGGRKRKARNPVTGDFYLEIPIPGPDLEIVAQLPSFSSGAGAGAGTAPSPTCADVAAFASDALMARQRWCRGVEALASVAAAISAAEGNGDVHRVHRRHLLMHCLSDGYEMTQSFSTLRSFFRDARLNSTVPVLRSWQAALEGENDSVLQLQSLIEDIERAAHEPASAHPKPKPKPMEIEASAPSRWGPGKRRKHALGIDLSSRPGPGTDANPNPNRDDPTLREGDLELWRGGVLHFFDAFHRTWLAPLFEGPGRELFKYQHTAALKHSFLPQPRTALQLALTDPQQMLPASLKAKAETKTKAESSASAAVDLDDLPLPDAGVAFAALEKGDRMVSVKEWLNSFTREIKRKENMMGAGRGAGASGAEPDSDAEADVEAEAEAKAEDKIHARFVRATMELQRLGLVKETNRRADHAVRLAFGTL